MAPITVYFLDGAFSVDEDLESYIAKRREANSPKSTITENVPTHNKMYDEYSDLTKECVERIETNRDWVVESYINGGMTAKTIAGILNISKDKLTTYFQKYNIRKNKKGQPSNEQSNDQTSTDSGTN